MLPITRTAENKSVNYAILSVSWYRRILELGPFDGVDTIALSKHADEVVSVEGRGHNIEIARKNLDEHGVLNATLIQQDLENFELATLGRFDCVWASGILYHMVNPARLIQRITDVTSFCLGWTHLSTCKEGHFQPESVELSLAGFSSVSWWYPPELFLDVWHQFGWKCAFTTQPALHPNGHLAAQFIARKSA